MIVVFKHLGSTHLLYNKFSKRVYTGTTGPISESTRIGLGALTVERSFFPENERNDQERSHRSEKKNERLERVLKNFGTISKRTERNGTERELLEKNG